MTDAGGLLLSLARSLLIAYGIILLLAVLFAERLIFQPPPASYRETSGIIRITAADGVSLAARYLPNPAARFTILYSHGNGEDLGDIAPFLDELRGRGYAVFAYDYRGYGLSGGRPSEAGSYRDIEAAYDYLTGPLGVAPDRLILLGYSVGSGPAADLAVRRPVAGLVIESGFTTAFRAVTRLPLLPFDRFRTIDKVARLSVPLLVIHGRDDHIIPFSHGRRLYAAAPEPKRYLWVEKAGHWDLREAAGEGYWRTLRDFTVLLAEGPRRPVPSGRAP